MPNIKSAKKRVLVSKVNSAKNRAAKTEMKTMIKKFDAAVAAGEAVEAAYKTAVTSTWSSWSAGEKLNAATSIVFRCYRNPECACVRGFNFLPLHASACALGIFGK